MATSREERMQQRMRGAQRHQVQDVAFDLFFPEPEAETSIPAAATEPESTTSPIAQPQPVITRANPNTSAKRKRLDEDGPTTAPPPPPPQTQTQAHATPRASHGPVAVVGSSHQEEVDESPANAPGSGRRRRVVATGAAAGRSAALHEAVTAAESPLSSRHNKANVLPTRPAAAQKQIVSSSSPSLPPRSPHSDDIDHDPNPNPVDELSPELTAEPIKVPPKPVVARTSGGSMFAKLADAKRNAAEQRRLSGEDKNNVDSPDALDELSSPSFMGVGLADGTVASSPLARKSAAHARLSRPSPRHSTLSTVQSPPTAQILPDADQDELSPEQPTAPVSSSPATVQTRRTVEVPSSSPPTQSTAKRRRGRPRKTIESIPEVAEVEAEEAEAEEAEEIGEEEAARTIGKKRPRDNTRELSPELGSDRKAAETEGRAQAAAPAAKRRRRQGLEEQSPSAVQNRPRASKQSAKAQKKQPPAKTKAKTRETPAGPTKRKRRRREEDEDEAASDEEEAEGDGRAATGKRKGRSGPPVPISVQRFSRMRTARAGTEADEDEDGDGDGDDDIPFANSSGVNVVDVLAQVCEDIVEQKLQEVAVQAAEAREAAAAADGDASTREARRDAAVRRRALEAFQAELRARLLAQASALDAAHALRRRVRAAHKEKLALREEILRIRAEREQVALRMDALRARHQAASERAMNHANISAAMHDVDLAVEQGRAAPELTAAQKKKAELANLELTVSQIAEQLCGSGGRERRGASGGALQQIKDFNAFLERTAAVLEGRKAHPRMVAI